MFLFCFLPIFLLGFGESKPFLGKIADCPDCPIYEDVIRPDPNDRNAIVDRNMRWSNARVPYILAKELQADKAKIREAMQAIEKNTCVRFVERTNENYYINIFKGKPNDCHAMVGMVQPGQPLSLGEGCVERTLMIHELGHAIGFEHEHQRSDRDDYIRIIWDNIDPEFKFAFRKLEPHENWLINKFDFDSIMLYGDRAFSIDYYNKLTMIPKIPGVKMPAVFDKPGLSRSDVERINILYECPGYKKN